MATKTSKYQLNGSENADQECKSPHQCDATAKKDFLLDLYIKIGHLSTRRSNRPLRAMVLSYCTAKRIREELQDEFSRLHSEELRERWEQYFCTDDRCFNDVIWFTEYLEKVRVVGCRSFIQELAVLSGNENAEEYEEDEGCDEYEEEEGEEEEE